MSDSADSDRFDSYDFDLPAQSIAQTPAGRRDDSRLLLLGRAAGDPRHSMIRDLPSCLRPGDLLVMNDVRVRRARLHGRLASGSAVELLLLGEREDGCSECLARPGRRLRPGAEVGLPEGASAHVVERREGRVWVSFAGVGELDAYLERNGEVPLPPYIKRPDGPSGDDAERYQTVYAERGSAVAAPTAGLHFTPELLDALESQGIRRAHVRLDVGPATFLPVRVDTIGACRLEGERAAVPAETIAAIEETKRSGGRVIAVGTTTTRTLESRAASPEGLQPGSFTADAFIYPGWRFAVIDGLLTNFHLPKSTLLVLVSAFAGRERVLAAYSDAVSRGYRFYSYGDAMLIL